MGTAHLPAHPRATPKNTNSHQEKILWAKFTYCGEETRAIAKTFKNTKSKITYFTKNTLKIY